MSDYENWNDEYQDDIESQGMPLIRQGQSNSPKVLEGVFGIGDFLMPNGLVAKGCYQFLAIGCEDLLGPLGRQSRRPARLLAGLGDAAGH